MVADVAAEGGVVRGLRNRVEVAELDFSRELLRLVGLGFSVRQLSRALRTDPLTVVKLVKAAQKVAPCREGFSGADSYELCMRFSVGRLTREELIEELTRWEFVPREVREHDYFDDLRFSTPGSFDDVGQAFDDDLIDDEVYDYLLRAREKGVMP
ncbi:MAG: hypothetical protein ACRCSP_06220 [Rhodoglobus sp.]